MREPIPGIAILIRMLRAYDFSVAHRITGPDSAVIWITMTFKRKITWTPVDGPLGVLTLTLFGGGTGDPRLV